ncbi:MAG: DNA polymerase III subunit delta', partial [Hyphomicrobiales bacterium]|nr:DNA polymerase III subunit delta' [Hyphomicrobiales bacterium]
AWLMTGEAGIGKAAFAYRTARFVLAQQAAFPDAIASFDVPADSKTHRQVANLAHPGLFVIRRAWDSGGKRLRQSIAVDDIRALRHFLQRTAVTPWRVVIVDSADDLNVSSANALLKSLEEPPLRTVFLLISSAPGRLLPTIRSRCRTVRFGSLNDTDMQSAISQACAASDREDPSASQIKMLKTLAKGSPRHAMQLLDGGGLPLVETILTLLESLPRLDRHALHKLIASTSGKKVEAHEIAHNLIDEILAETIRARASGDVASARFSQLKRFPAIINAQNLADWAQLWETLREARSEAERLNLDKNALTLTSFEKIARLSQKAAASA